jgi:hypothetical protein
MRIMPVGNHVCGTITAFGLVEWLRWLGYESKPVENVGPQLARSDDVCRGT